MKDRQVHCEVHCEVQRLSARSMAEALRPCSRGWLGTDKYEGRHTLLKGIARIQGLYVQACMQEKYVRRKTDKYTVRATVQRPTARSLAETLFSWRPERIQYMRADTLAMLLTMANIGAHGRALVLDGCGGLVTGAVAERMGGFGQVYNSQDPLNLAKDLCASLETGKASQSIIALWSQGILVSRIHGARTGRKGGM